MSKVKTITVTNSSTSATETIPAAISQIYYNDKNNLNIVTDSTDIVSNKGGKINIEAASDIQFKPGDDMILYSHHREAGKNDEVAVKVTNGDDYPVKLQVNAANLTITTKDKDLTKVYTTDPESGTKSGQVSTTSEDEIFDVNVNTGKSGTSDNKKAYLKVRARAIDLRCEEHGGIALQPKGNDADGNENKVKFEHGGGDGLEFLTMNTKHTSIFTNDYRFNKEGKVYMATRTTLTSDKADSSDSTTAKLYVKQSDDFYDVISDEDKVTTWEDIINAGNAFEDGDLTLDECANVSAEYKISKKGNVSGQIPTLKYEVTNNLPSTYSELTSNGGTITEDEYNTLSTSVSDVTTSNGSISLKDLIDIVNELKTMKANSTGPWASEAA